MRQLEKNDANVPVCDTKPESREYDDPAEDPSKKTGASDPAPGVYEAAARLIPPLFQGSDLERLSIIDYRDRFVKRYGEPSCFEDCLLIIQAYKREAMIYMQETCGPDMIDSRDFSGILGRKAGRVARLENYYRGGHGPANVKSAGDAWLDDAICSDIALMWMADLRGRSIGWYPVTSVYWTSELNPVSGCTQISEACRNCFAKANHDLLYRPDRAKDDGDLARPDLRRLYRNPFNQVTLQAEQLEDELARLARNRVPQVVFVGNRGDLFHRDVPFPHIARVFDGIAGLYADTNPGHTFLLLTKRAQRMKDFMDWYMSTDAGGVFGRSARPHVWLGVTAENQRRADERIPFLLSTPSAHRWISVEPMLGPVDLVKFFAGASAPDARNGSREGSGIELVIAGGEAGRRARETSDTWFKSLYGQCKLYNTRFYLTQLGDAFKGQLPAGSIGLDAYKMPFSRVVAP